jgi:hypothetical protein
MKRASVSCIALGLLLGVVGTAQASISTIPNPSGTSEIGARIRWGASGFEGSLYDSSPFGQTPTLNPSGSPVWQLNVPYAFQVTFDSSTGELGLSVDFNRNNSFGAGESIFRTSFSTPGQTSYSGFGFDYIEIRGNEGGSTARSEISNLTINGDAQANLAPNGAFINRFYADSNGLLANVTITGNLTFTTSGTSQERPAYDFVFGNASQVIPEASTVIVWSVLSAIAGVGYLRRRQA